MTADPADDSLELSNESPQLELILKDLSIDLDPIDAENFDVVSYINEVWIACSIISQLFPSEQSLSAVDDIIASIGEKIESIDDQTRKIIRGQWKVEEQGEKVVEEASSLIQSLFEKWVSVSFYSSFIPFNFFKSPLIMSVNFNS